jgi:hypothetical protein
MWLAIASSVIPLLSVFGITLDVGEYGAKMSESAKLIKSIPDRLKRGPWGVLMEVKKTKDNPY